MPLKRTRALAFYLAAGAVFAVIGFASSNARAQSCSATADDIAFGTVDLTGGGTPRTSGRIRLQCQGTPNQWLRVCINLGSGSGGNAPSGDPRYMLSGANRLDYNLYTNNAATNIWGSYVWPYPPRGRQVFLRLRGNGRASRNYRVTGRIKPGQAGAQPGFYISSFSGGHTLINYAYWWQGNCNAISGLGNLQIPFNVTATIQGACTVTTTDLDFGNASILSANIDSTNRIRVRCASGLPYSIGLSNGSSGGTGPAARLMSAGSGTVTYGIYQNAARSIVWGDTIGVNTRSGTGTGGNQNYTAYGRVPPQTSPAPNTYTDTITVTVTY